MEDSIGSQQGEMNQDGLLALGANEMVPKGMAFEWSFFRLIRASYPKWKRTYVENVRVAGSNPVGVTQVLVLSHQTGYIDPLAP